jgi:putative transposase
MNNLNNLSDSRWECKYHVVWIPKCRRKVLFGQLRKHLVEVFYDFYRQKISNILEGHRHQDHVHVLMSIPLKYSVAQVAGYPPEKFLFMKTDTTAIVGYQHNNT